MSLSPKRHFWCHMNVEPLKPKSSKLAPGGWPSLIAAAIRMLLPLFIGILSLIAQLLWHDYYWGIPTFGGEYIHRAHTVEYAAVAFPLWFFSAAFFIIVVVYSVWKATRRGALSVIGTVFAAVVGGLVLAFAGLTGLMGGA